jgi:two-component system phosphate regulon sensor histidine kinase PhoR
VTFSRRLATGTFVVVVAALAVLLWRAERSLRSDLEADVVSQLERSASLVTRALPDNHAEWQRTVRELSLESGIRITVISTAGVVLADSDFPEGPLGAIENHASRPEVQSALAGWPCQTPQRDRRSGLHVRGDPRRARRGPRR